MTLYTQVSANRSKTILFLGLYAALILLLGYVASEYFGSSAIFYFAAIVTVIQGWVSYYASDTVALAVAHAKPLERLGNEEVYDIVETLCITAGLPVPRLFRIPDTAMNAFATGRDANHAAIAITDGLLTGLNRSELQGVIAHELSHIGNEDIKLMGMVAVMAGMIALISDIMMRSFFWGNRRDDREGGGILPLIALGLAILAPIAATLIQLAISRKREFLADASGVLLTRYPEGLISALRKINADQEPLEAANRGTAHMYFANPLKGKSFASLFSTHPPVEQRIAALEQGTGMVTSSS